MPRCRGASAILAPGGTSSLCHVSSPVSETLPSPDDKRLFLLLLKLGLNEEDAYSFVQELQIMASANLIAQFQSAMESIDARLEAQNSKLGTYSAALNSKMRILLWIVSMGVILISTVITFNALLG